MCKAILHASEALDNSDSQLVFFLPLLPLFPAFVSNQLTIDSLTFSLISQTLHEFVFTMKPLVSHKLIAHLYGEIFFANHKHITNMHCKIKYVYVS